MSCQGIGDPSAVVLASSPHFRGVRSQQFSLGCQSHQLVALVKNPAVAGLQSLELRYDDLLTRSGEWGDAGAASLAGARQFESLRRLVLERGHVGAEGLRALLMSPFLSGLIELECSGNPVGVQGAEYLANSAVLSRLRRLSLAQHSWDGYDDEGYPQHGLRLGADGAEILCSSPSVAQLMSLNLADNELGARGAGSVAASPYLAGLRELDLRDNELTDVGVESLAAALAFAGLTTLNLSFNNLTDDGMRALAASPSLADLRRLDLAGNEIGDAGLRVLAESPYLTRLRRLDLSTNPFTSAGLRLLVSSANAGRLSHLSLGGHSGFRPDDEAVTAIADSPYLTQLNELELSFTRISEAAARRLTLSSALPRYRG